MARIPDGINGPIVGSVGSVVGSSRNGKAYVKKAHKKRTKKVSAKELGNRGKFKLSQLWLSPLLGFVQVGYSLYKKNPGAFIKAKSYLQLNAMEGTAPDISINPALMKVSVGELPLSANIGVSGAGGNQLQFTWDTAYVADGSRYDQAMLLAYDVENNRATYKTTGQFRSVGADMLIIEPGKKYHVYFAFNAADRSRQSDSLYLGEVIV